MQTRTEKTLTTERTVAPPRDDAEHGSTSITHETSRLRRLLTLSGAALAVFTSIGFMNAFGVFQAYYSLVPLRHYTEFQISWIGSFATFLTFVGAAPAGILSDRYGPRVPMLIGATCMLIGIFTTSVCTEYYQFFLAQGTMLAMGMGFSSIPVISAVAVAFKRHKGLVLGASVGGSSIGGLIWPIVLNKLINEDGISFGWSIRAVGFIMLGCLAFAIVTVPLGLPPRAATEKKVGKAKGKDNSLLRKPAVILLCIAIAVIYLGLFSPFFYITTYGLAHNVDNSLAFYLVSILNGASLFGRLGGGIASDKFGAFNLITLATLASALICLCWTAATSTAAIIVFAAAYGFTSGAIMSLQAACAAQLSTPETYGTLIGVLLGSASLTGLFGTPISGQLVQHGYLALSMYAGAAMLLGGLLMLVARLLQDRRLTARV